MLAITHSSRHCACASMTDLTSSLPRSLHDMVMEWSQTAWRVVRRKC